jgi:UDP-N-acetylglucosamine 2-epimerase (non-hydrolysing)
MKICVILGTRPEIIKMAPVVRELHRRNIDHFMIHTGQHYSYAMDKVFFEDLELLAPQYNLNVGSGSHGKQTGAILQGIEEVLLKERPDAVLVQGDTNTVLAGALAAVKQNIGVGHVEAGLRSFDRKMPEEINRIMADHVSDLLFPPTQTSKENLLHEGIPSERIFVTGNTIVDAVHQNMRISEKRSIILKEMGLVMGRYILATMHRQENVDDPVRLTEMLAAIGKMAVEMDVPALLPMHPRTRKNLVTFKIEPPKQIRIVDPVGYLDFLQLEGKACLLMTDSGGIQEEGCILGVPCVTMRDSTERPETIEAGANILAGSRSDDIVVAAREMLSRKKGWTCPLGNGDASAKIVEIMAQHYQ